ncbi:YceI family protein [Roseibium limicola]|uniref:YceI family protein n=1 Tax=Roseibium limicola TaxID=2816037 RepID=A0A939J7D9_9HYPH|nr:YceI family protein [Roseibium limicola]MBO0346072.1 YceI family protein [Roseibium limicola]
MMKSLICAVAALPLLAGAAAADTWTVDPATSTLGFQVKQADGQVDGKFESWQASIDFDPEAPQDAVISAKIETGSAITGNAQYDDMLAQPDYFNSATLGSAEFKTTSVSPVDDETFQAEGILTIKGVSQPVTLDFTLKIEGDTAHAVGEASLSRTTYDIGSSVATATLADVVTVTLDLTASR